MPTSHFTATPSIPIESGGGRKKPVLQEIVQAIAHQSSNFVSGYYHYSTPHQKK
jgi:hypothetical protein